MQLIGIGRLGRDVEVRYTSQGESVANLALAYNWGQKGQDGKKPTQWVEASLWGKRAEALAPYLLKGSLVCVTIDDARIDTYQTRDGGTGSRLVGRVSNIEFAGGAPQQQSGGAARPAAAQRPAAAPPPKPATGFDDEDGDIPF